MSDQSDAGENATLQKHVNELQEVLEQATKGIAALAAGSWSGRTAQLVASAMANSARDSDTKKSAFKSATKAGPGKFGQGNAGKRHDPKVDLCRICNKPGHWAKECDQHKEPAKEQADIKTVSFSLVSPTRIYLTAEVNK